MDSVKGWQGTTQGSPQGAVLSRFYVAPGADVLVQREMENRRFAVSYSKQ